MKCLLGRTIGMWLNWRASWYLVPRDEEVNSGSIEKERREGNSVPLEKRVSLVLQFLSDSSLGVKPFFIVHFTLHNIIVWSYFIVSKCKIIYVVLMLVGNQLSQIVFSWFGKNQGSCVTLYSQEGSNRSCEFWISFVKEEILRGYQSALNSMNCPETFYLS